MLRFVNVLRLIALANAVATSPGPSEARLTVIGSNEIRVDWEPPIFDGGSDITSYLIEWDTTAGATEVQRISTKLNLETNEIQSITTSVEDVDEVQIIRTRAIPRGSVQAITVSPPPDEINLDSMYKYSLKLDTTNTGGSIHYSGDITATALPEGSRLSLAEIIGSMANVDSVPNVTISEMNENGGFTYMVTFPPSMKTVPPLELYVTDIPVFINVVDEANLLQGYFRLEFEGELTDPIPYDASESVMQQSLTKLSSIDEVQVQRSSADDQNGYSWRIQFTSNSNSGNLDNMIVHSEGLTTTNMIGGATCFIDFGGTDGSYITGTFVVSHGGESTDPIPSNVEANQLKEILQNLTSVGIVDVERSAETNVGGYTWTISFRDDVYGTNRGDVPPFLVTSHLGGGSGFIPAISVNEVRPGTWKEVQRISISAGGATVDPESAFRLSFAGHATNEILALPLGGSSCLGSKTAKQIIRSSTEDTSKEGGDDTVSHNTFFKMHFGGFETPLIPANNGTCEYTAAIMSEKLRLLPPLNDVSVIGKSSDVNDEGCEWEVSLLSTVGNPDLIKVSLYNDVFQAGPGTNVTVGDTPAVIRDRIVVFQPDGYKGDVNLIQAELSRLQGIGIVSVSPESEYPDEFLQCSWRVTFESKAGDIPSLVVSEAASNFFSSSATMLSGDVISVEDDVIQGTSVALSGDFVLEIQGQRTKYLPFDATANQVRSALSGLLSVGDVQVSREGPDENMGYTWDVTFLESIGSIELVVPDYADLQGTAATITVSRLVMGKEPPFNGPDYGKIVLQNLDDRSLVVDHLKQGIDYFFRVTTINSEGHQFSSFTRPSKAKPLPQPPSGTETFGLNVLDGSSILLTIGAPLYNGGGTVTSYRVDYAETAFQHERQRVSIKCSPKPEVQRIRIDAPDLNEKQFIVIDSSYGGFGIVQEVQRVFCDASGGEFGLGFGSDMRFIQFDSNEDDVKRIIESISFVSSVDVTFENGSQYACAPGGSSFLITFYPAYGMSGDIPLLRSVSSSLSGARYIEVTEFTKGDAPPSGFFSLSFRGAKTRPIPVSAFPSDVSVTIESELLALDTVESDGVRVIYMPLTSGPELVFEVEFIGNGVGGDVPALEVKDDFVHGSSAKILILSDGEKFIAANGVDIFESKPGNFISGVFKLRLRGHLTDEIHSNASADELQDVLERLPNIDTVNVEQGPITNEDGRSWDVTFLSSQGYFPPLTRNFDILKPVNYLKTSRIDSSRPTISVEEIQKGDEPLTGQFYLSFFDGQSYETTQPLDSFISADDLKRELESLSNIGVVSVTRTETHEGYSWDIEFNACSLKNGKDICNDGDLPLLNPTNVSLSGCGGALLTVTELVAGSEAGQCEDLVDAKCSISSSVNGGNFPLHLLLDNLTFGTEYFLQIRFRSEYGYGHRRLSHPLSGIPSHNPPGPMHSPYLIESSATSITIGWDMPNTNGGSAVIGYELWMNEYGAVENVLVYDGVGSPNTFQFKLSTVNIGPNSQSVESGRQYQFQVRALNSCNGQSEAPCFGPFSDVEVFTVRDPRVPQPPPAPWREMKTLMHSISTSVSVAWKRPIDNGGSPITGYILYIKDSRNVVTTRSVSSNSRFWTETGLNKGEIYHFYVVAINAVGRSGNSAILTAIAATYPGLGGPGDISIVQEQLRPVVIDATESMMTVRWSALTSDYSGGSPIEGYKLYMYITNNISFSADLQARLEVQRIVKPDSVEMTGSFSLSFGKEETVHIGINASAIDLKFALENLRSINIVSVNDIINGWEIRFLSEPGDLPLLKASTGRLLPVGSSLIIEEVIRGDDAILVFEGTDLYATVRNLVAGSHYTFKVSAFNTIGDGLLSNPSESVLARSGASASQTTASGSTLHRGIAGTIQEVQLISFSSEDCDRDILSLTFIDKDYFTENLCGFSATNFESAIEKLPLIGDVHVTRRDLLDSAGSSGHEWSVTFVSLDGDVPMLLVNPFLSNYGKDISGRMGTAASFVAEYLKGRKNEFIIEPKRSSGAVVTDEQVVESSRGEELFFTELWKPIIKFDGSHDWVADGGVASYNPYIYEEQIILVPDEVASFTLTMDTSTYIPGGRLGGLIQTTYDLSMPISEHDLKVALDSLENVKETKVSSISGNKSTTFIVTFTAIYGEMPLLTASNSRIHISRSADKVGVTEIQTVTLSTDTTFRYEIQNLILDSLRGSIILNFGGKQTNQIYYNISDSSSLESLRSELQHELNLIDDLKVAIKFIPTGDDDFNSNIFQITFFEPVGDLNLLQTDNGNILEVISGYSPLRGSFVLEFYDQYTTNIPYNASAIFMKEALESLHSIEQVNVEKHEIKTGFKWDISFIRNLGNLPNIRACNNRFEVQKISTAGGYPTPLGGSFTLTYNSETTTALPFDASSHLVKASLESLPSIGRVDVQVTLLDNGQREWMITFRVPEEPSTLLIDHSNLTGTFDSATVEIIVSALRPSVLSSSGLSTEITVIEKVPGLPSYTGSYVINTIGSYALSVMQLHQGGLSAWYYDNIWFLDEPSVERIDKSLNFDWGTGPITRYGRDYVSIRWWGKLKPLSTEIYTFYMTCNEGGRLYIDHKLILDDWDSAWEGVMKAAVELDAMRFYDIKVEYKDLVGAANIVIEWSTKSIPRQTIPSDQLYYGHHISGSPFLTEVTAGASDYPYSEILNNPNSNLTHAIAGEQAHFYIQARDSQGNLKTDYDNSKLPDGQFTVDFFGPSGLSAAEVIYVESGKFRADFILLKTGTYKVHVRTGGTDIFCGQGELNKCSPFSLEVSPGASVSHMSEVESSSRTHDSLSEAIAGQTGVAYIRARDNFGNNQIRGGDNFEVKFTSLTNEMIQYRGYVIDHGDGSYKLTYSIPLADTYRMSVTLNGKPIRHCVGSVPPFIYDRYYDGISIYSVPDHCSHSESLLSVVHNSLHPASSTAISWGNQKGLERANAGIETGFIIESRDKFGNIRAGIRTKSFSSVSDGSVDAFLVKITDVAGNIEVLTSSLVQVIRSGVRSTIGYFRVKVAQEFSIELPYDVSAETMQYVLNHMHVDPLSTLVNRREIDGGLEWRVTFLSHFNEVIIDPLSIHPGSDDFSDFSETLSVETIGQDGIYPISYTIWKTGVYYLIIESNGMLVSDQTFTITVDNSFPQASSTDTFGEGLTKAIAGEESSFFIQVRDAWLPEIQIIHLSSNLIEKINEVQEIHINSPMGTEFQLSFRGRTTEILQVGVSSLSDLKSALEALDSCGNVLVSSSLGEILVVQGDKLLIEFQTVTGDLPLLQSSVSDDIKRHIKGQIPFRMETQIIECTGVFGTATMRYAGATIVVNAIDTVEEVAEKLSSLLGCPVLVTDVTNYGIVCSSLGSILRLDIKQYRDVPSIEIEDYNFQSGSIFVFGDGQEEKGAINGLGPLMGSFRLSFRDYETDEIFADASAEEVERSLGNLPSIGSVTVSKDSLGLCRDHTGINILDNKTCGANVWIITFGNINKKCEPPDWNFCPSMIGNVDLIEINGSLLSHPSYAPETIFKPILVSTVIRDGTRGNNVQVISSTGVISAHFVHENEDHELSQEQFRMDYLENGLYQVFFTPKVSGHYNTFIKLGGELISTDLSIGLSVRPSRPNAVLSSHNSKLIAKVGDVHTFTITASDRFGNQLISSLDDSDSFIVSAIGFPHSCSGILNQNILEGDVHLSPDQDGKYIVALVPKVSGTYDIRVLLRSRGGLLTTFYRNVDFTDPVFRETDNEGNLWCPGGSYRCDSTKISEGVNFNWGFDSPLANDEINSLNFPLDSFSVTWKGMILSPVDGVVTFFIKSDGGAQLKISNVTVIDGFTSTTKDLLLGKIEFKKDEFYELQLSYIHEIDDSYISLLWDVLSDGVSVPVPSNYLFYSRHIGSYDSSDIPSPFRITSVPGAISPNSFAVGEGLDGCISMEKCSFTIQTQDLYGNNRYTTGYESGFEISIKGIDGWALQGRMNDDTTFSNPISIEGQVETLGWEYIGSFDTVHLSYTLSSDVAIDIDLSRRDVLSIDGALYRVAENAHAGDFELLLDDAYLGDSKEKIAVHRVSDSCGETGTNLVTYSGYVHGKYELNVKLPSRHSIYQVSTFAPSSKPIYGSFILILEMQSGYEFSTIDIPYNASEDFVRDAIKAAPDLEGIDVSRKECNSPELQCSWEITFIGTKHNPTKVIVPYWDDLLFGSKVDVTILQTGQESKSISGFPRIISIEPAFTSPIWSTMYGQGLKYATAGTKASFIIQPKDSYGNDIDCRHANEVLWEVIMIPENWSGDRTKLMKGLTSPLSNCAIKVEYLPVISGKYTIVATGTTNFEIQKMQTSFDSFLRGGTFKLVLNSEVTEPISWNATTDAIQRALEKLDGIQSVIVSREIKGPLNSIYSITFNGTVGDIPQLEVDVSNLIGNSGAWPIDSKDGFFEHVMAVPEDVIIPNAYRNHVLKSEVQSITIHAPDKITKDMMVSLSFMGYNTTISATSNQQEIRASLESLPVIGTVNVTIEIQERYRIWIVTFTPLSNGREKNLYNFGNLPQILATCHDAEAETATIHQGYSPFQLTVEPSHPSALHTLATDLNGKMLSDVIMSGLYKSRSYFKLFTHDEYQNRIQDGPRPEVQILEITEWEADDKISLNFEVDEVELSAYANPSIIEQKLRQIPTLERVVVTSNSAKSLVDGIYMSVLRGRVTAIPSNKLVDFEIGDWIRIDDENGFIYTIVEMQSAPPFAITLSAPYLGQNSPQAKIYKRESRGNQSVYRYMIFFDAALGDVPSLTLTKHSSAESLVNANVVSCDRNEMFDVDIVGSNDDELVGSFTIQIGIVSTTHIPISIDSDSLADILLTTFDSFHSLNVELLYDSLHRKIWRLHFSNVIPEILKHEIIEIDARFLTTRDKAKVNVSITPTCPTSSDSERSNYGIPGLDFYVELYGPEVVYGDIVYVGEGIYQGSYETPRVGEYKMRVESVRMGGLLGEYFSNRWLFGTPVLSRVDKLIDFYWDEGEPITSTGKDFVSIRWSGYLKPSFSEVYSFLLRVNDGVRLWIGKEILIDKYDINVSDDGTRFYEYNASTTSSLTAGRLIDIKIEFRENRGDAKIQLLWESASQQRSIISSTSLYSNPEHVVGSPFNVSPIAVKPSEPQNLTVEVRDFDEVELIWDAPTDSGGEDIVEYLIEYWDSSSTDEDAEILRLIL